MRLQSPKGVSNKLNFEVGQYPNVIENTGIPANGPTPVNQLPATLCGQIFPGEIDVFSFQVTKGMNLVASVKARTLVPFIADAVPGWFQPVIRLKNSKGREIAYNDDFRNAVDPVIITGIEEDDTYSLSIQDAIFRGREDFNYRIELGEIPFLEYVYPCVGKTGKNAEVELKGVNLRQNKMQFKPGVEGYGELTAAGINGLVSNPVIFWGVPRNAVLDVTASAKEEYLTNTILYDSLSSPYQLKTYRIELQKNEMLAVGMKARRLGSMLDAKMTLRDRYGRKLIESDDVEDASQGLMTHHADP